jgi:glucose-6-phosphate isomerase
VQFGLNGHVVSGIMEKSDNQGKTLPHQLEMLQKSNKRLSSRRLPELLSQPGRFDAFTRKLDGLLLDFSRIHLDEQALDELLELAEFMALGERRAELFAGRRVNNTEQRAALHMAIRSPDLLQAAGEDEAERVRRAGRAMLAMAADLHIGRLPGDPGQPIRHLVHVGIGGSMLGTRLVCEALDQDESTIEVHFLGSVDAGPRERLLARLDPADTVVVMVSKSFTTPDTLLHGQRIRTWLEKALGADAAGARMFAVTNNVGGANAFGIEQEQQLFIPDWLGGRYSLWSPVSLAAAALIGPARFEELLAGAADMDAHFMNTPLAENLPVLWGLVGVWQRNFRGHSAWGVMPYTQRLHLLPSYLQQLVMESTGKSVRRSGQPVTMATAPLVFGETGTDAQHSLFQAMHQGTDIIPLSFIGVVRPGHADHEAHNELLANMLAQMAALSAGRSAAEMPIESGQGDDAQLPHRTFPGNRPSDLVLLDALNPRSLGMLLALFEHRVFVESVIWDINAFDQWGVELGKTLAPGIRAALSDEADDPGPDPLLEYIKSLR